jgi:hypothetical protein
MLPRALLPVALGIAVAALPTPEGLTSKAWQGPG